MTKPARQYELGVQSFTYRDFSVPELCQELGDTDISAIELCHEHVMPDVASETLDSIQQDLDDAGLDICGYSVVGFDADDDEGDIRETMSMIDQLGGEYCSLEFPPADDAVRKRLLSVGAEFDLDLAIHNHGPGETYSTVTDVTRVLDKTDDTRLGACVDTGHFFRSGEAPADVFPRLGERVLALNVKDFADEETEVVPGTGQLDIP
jgi:sugar phosphate isomerase/epimerase